MEHYLFLLTLVDIIIHCSMLGKICINKHEENLLHMSKSYTNDK